jgi:hypothetical protein
MKKEEKTTKSAFIQAFEKSETKSVADLCRIVGVSRFTFYYHFNKDADFRKSLLEKQREYLGNRIVAV